MAISRQVLPSPVLEAIEECVKAAKQHGFVIGRDGRSEESGQEFHKQHGFVIGTEESGQEFQVLQTSRRALVIAIENHAKSMFEGGIEIGRDMAEGHAK